jgi:cysteinyl-tRNA synthetase
MTLKLYNTLTRKKEDFVPITPGQVKMYACGPTVYSYAHIGNARMAVVFDVLARILRADGLNVTFVSNITDIDDKIIDAAAKLGEPISAITEKFGRIYNEDMASLGNRPFDVQPKATEHIPEMIRLIENLIDRNHAYAASHDGQTGQTVLFHVPSYLNYGALSGRSRDDQIAGARVEVAPYKRDPADFVLWKPSTPDQPGWDSPWGRGRPGWHIECSAMAEKHLGLPFDIHCGGTDLKFPHHENEIAQSCCAHGDHPAPAADFARYWAHNGFVTVEGERMGKSNGNFILPRDLLDRGIPGEAIRWALLATHYRAPFDWSEQRLTDARKHLDGIYDATANLSDTEKNDPIDPEVFAALADDLNTPLALTRLIQLQKDAAKGNKQAAESLYPSAKFMGFLNQPIDAWKSIGQPHKIDIDIPWIEKQIARRAQTKKDKDFKTSDQIRNELLAQGIIIKDTPDGPVWMIKS